MPEGEEKEKEIENLFEKIMNENFPNLVKEIDCQEVQEAQRIPKKLDPRKHTPRHIIIKLPKIKDKERILKAAREKQTLCLLTQPKEGQQQISKQKTTRTDRKWNCMEVQQPRR